MFYPEEMTNDPLRLWRDALKDLDVMGLVLPDAPLPQEATRPLARPVVAPKPPPAPVRSATPSPAPRVEERVVACEPVVTLVTPPASALAPNDPVAYPPASGWESTATLSAMEKTIQGCLACPLGKGRIRFVFGEGNPRAELMFIGEGPGRDEDLQGRPFVGKAGELLDKMIGAMGFKREQVYIANVVKCRPPDNRTPLPAESQCCLPYLKKQILLVQPRVIVTLGATPLRELLGIKTGITQVRGQWKRLALLEGIPVMPTFHPAYVLRQYTQDVRRAVWNDLLAVKTWLEQPKTP